MSDSKNIAPFDRMYMRVILSAARIRSMGLNPNHLRADFIGSLRAQMALGDSESQTLTVSELLMMAEKLIVSAMNVITIQTSVIQLQGLCKSAQDFDLWSKDSSSPEICRLDQMIGTFMGLFENLGMCYVNDYPVARTTWVALLRLVIFRQDEKADGMTFGGSDAEAVVLGFATSPTTPRVLNKYLEAVFGVCDDPSKDS